MKFFVPAAEDDAQAERVYKAIATFNHAPVTGRRIWKLAWQHNGMQMHCAVGEPLPGYYRTGSEPVLAILDKGQCFAICTPNRGGVRGEPIYAGSGFDTIPTFFEGS